MIDDMQAVWQNRKIQINYTEEFVIENSKNLSERTAEIVNSQAIKAASKSKLDLMGYMMPYYALSQIKSEISKIVKLLQGGPKQSINKDSYDLPEAASYLNIGKSTLRKALSDKEIIGDRVGRKWRFTKAQLDRYIRRGKSDAEIDMEVENAIISRRQKKK